MWPHSGNAAPLLRRLSSDEADLPLAERIHRRLATDGPPVKPVPADLPADQPVSEMSASALIARLLQIGGDASGDDLTIDLADESGVGDGTSGDDTIIDLMGNDEDGVVDLGGDNEQSSGISGAQKGKKAAAKQVVGAKAGRVVAHRREDHEGTANLDYDSADDPDYEPPTDGSPAARKESSKPQPRGAAMAPKGAMRTVETSDKRELLPRFKDHPEGESVEPPATLHVPSLYPYQKAGLAFMLRREGAARGACEAAISSVANTTAAGSAVAPEDDEAELLASMRTPGEAEAEAEAAARAAAAVPAETATERNNRRVASFSVEQIRGALMRRGLRIDGNRHEVTARLRAFVNGRTMPVEAVPKMNMDLMSAALTALGEPTHGSRSELLQRLQVALFNAQITDPITDVRPRGGLLADEQGMGKTVQMLALCLAHPAPPADTPAAVSAVAPATSGPTAKGQTEAAASVINLCDDTPGRPQEEVAMPRGGTLIVAPLVLLRQWQREIESKVDPAVCPSRVLVYHGPKVIASLSLSACKACVALPLPLSSYHLLQDSRRAVACPRSEPISRPSCSGICLWSRRTRCCAPTSPTEGRSSSSTGGERSWTRRIAWPAWRLRCTRRVPPSMPPTAGACPAPPCRTPSSTSSAC